MLILQIPHTFSLKTLHSFRQFHNLLEFPVLVAGAFVRLFHTRERAHQKKKKIQPALTSGLERVNLFFGMIETLLTLALHPRKMRFPLRS